MNKKNCLYLVSSSSNREYVMDCVEALAVPRGIVQHFRYRLKYMDELLERLVPLEGDPLPSELQDLPVLVVYLYQTQTAGTWKPGETMGPGGPYMPIRYGRLLQAFRDGDVAHFFFEASDYVIAQCEGRPTRELLNELRFKRTTAEDAKSSYAHLAPDLDIRASREADTLSFQTFVDKVYRSGEWRTRSLGSAPLDVTYDIVFYRVVELVCEGEGGLDPVIPVRRVVGASVSSEYILESGSTYHLRIATHLRGQTPAELPGHGNATLRLSFDPTLVRPMGLTSLRVSSYYDLEYWSFAVYATEDQRSVLRVVCEHERSVGRRHFLRNELLCPEISLPISVVRRKT